MNKTVACFVLCLFLADYVSMYLSVSTLVFSKASPSSEQCGCTCCGDVCTMGDACCCSEDAAKQPKRLPGLLYIQPDCRPDFQWFAYTSIFSRTGIWMLTERVRIFAKEQNITYFIPDILSISSPSYQPDTPPPESHFFSVHIV